MGSHLKDKHNNCKAMRDHDYLFDKMYIVPGEKDHNKIINKLAVNTSQVTVMPIFDQMFSELKSFPSIQKAYIPNVHLPDHLDLSYSGRIDDLSQQCIPVIKGKDRFRFFATPKQSLLDIKKMENVQNILQNSPIQLSPKGLLIDKSVQTAYRDSSAQTYPYQPDYVINEECKNIPEVLFLEDVQIEMDDIKKGIDISIVQWVKRQRVKRAWLEAKPTFSILSQLEYYEQKQREAEIEEMLNEQMESSNYIEDISHKTDVEKTTRLWINSTKKLEMDIEKIRKNKERDIRKLHEKTMLKKIKMDNRISWPPFILPRVPFMIINPDFIPSLKSIDNKKKSYENILSDKSIFQKGKFKKININL